MTKTDDAPSIESVDAFARQLYRRTRDAGTDFVDLAIAIHNLHTKLKHLDDEAQDHDSPLHDQSDSVGGVTQASVYTRQLRPLIEDSDFALRQVSTVLEKHRELASTGGTRRDSDLSDTARKIDLIRGDVVSQAMKIDIFLDTVQLHNPGKPQPAPENVNDQQMDEIKNKVDAVANRLFAQQKDRSPIEADEDELWRSFKTELEREGFSPEVLRKNKVGATAPFPPHMAPNISHGMS